MTRINVQVIPARKVMESVGSRKFRGVFVRKKVDFVWIQDNVVVTSVKRRNAINFEVEKSVFFRFQDSSLEIKA